MDRNYSSMLPAGNSKCRIASAYTTFLYIAGALGLAHFYASTKPPFYPDNKQLYLPHFGFKISTLTSMANPIKLASLN